uniref:Uncharacterized protein n=1 Tax=Trichobilharzia regenti TaxID=157069 RepID=A0AA85J9H0_TRIRE|nr:unnamed protein product [Trichobilharzia regenti]
MSDDKRIVPWIDANEFSNVARHVSSMEVCELDMARKAIEVWLCRMPASKIPRSIVCTYELLNGYLERSSQSMALALMRFVSLVSSESQDRERPSFALPILSLARKAGLPSWLADLRNDVAHGTMPSTDVLESAFWWSLRYLGDFWMLNVKYHEERMIELGNMLKSYSSMICSYLERLLQGEEIAMQSDLIEAFTSRLSPLCLLYVTDHVCYHGCDLLASGCALGDIVEIQAKNLKPLLSFLQSYKLLNELVMQFILGLEDDDSSFMDIRLSWCVGWVKAISHKSGGTILCDYVDKLVIDWRLAFNHVLNCVCDKFEELVVALLSTRDPPVSDEKLEMIKSHINVFYGYGISNVHEDIRTGPQPRSQWNLSKSLSWSEKPLGALMNLPQDASTSGQHKRVPAHDTEGGRQIC